MELRENVNNRVGEEAANLDNVEGVRQCLVPVYEATDLHSNGRPTSPARHLELNHVYDARHHTNTFVRSVSRAAYAVAPVVDDDRPDYAESKIARYNCLPPPVFLILISLVQVGVCAHHQRFLKFNASTNNALNRTDNATSHATISRSDPVTDVLEYNPWRRKEVWRLFSCMLVHESWSHLIENIVVQILLGVPLEMVHKYWRVALVYLGGGIAGTLGASMVHPTSYLTGASGGIFALLFAHLASMVVNWENMKSDRCCYKHPFDKIPANWIRLTVWIVYVVLNLGDSVYLRHVLGDTSITYASHLFGAGSGFLLGVVCLKNFDRWKPGHPFWEDVLWWTCLTLTGLFFVFAVLWNIFWRDYPHQLV